MMMMMMIMTIKDASSDEWALAVHVCQGMLVYGACRVSGPIAR